MNFSKFSFFDVCVSCVIAQTQIKFHKIFMKSKKQNKYENKCIKRLKSNNENEYMLEEFDKFEFQNDIK